MALRPQSDTVHRTTYERLRLWRDDLEKIDAMLRDVSPDVVIEVDDWYADSIADLNTIESKTVNRVSFDLPEQRVSLVLAKAGSEITAINPSFEVRGMIASIDDVLRRRALRPHWWYKAIFAPLVFVPLVIYGIVDAVFGESLSTRQLRAVAIIAFSLSVVAFLCGAIGDFRETMISSRSRSEHLPWLERNRDALAANAVVSLVFLIIGIVIGLLLP